MTTPSYDQLIDFYYDFLESEQEREKEEQNLIELLQALLEEYHSLADNIVELRSRINSQHAEMQNADIVRHCNPPFFDLYSDIQADFSHYKAYQKYASYLDKSNRLEG